MSGREVAVQEPVALDAPQEASVTSLVEMAIREKVPVEMLERLVALQERVMARDARKEYFQSLAAFQQECPPINTSKTANVVSKRTGTQFSYKYAPLPEITRTILPYLSKYGLSFQWTTEPTTEKGVLNVVCILRHIDGHEERAGFPTPIDSGDRMSAAQSNGAALTYGRRQSLIAVLGLTTADVDTDAAPGHEPPEPLTDAQLADLSALLEEVGADRTKFLRWMGVQSLADIPQSDYGRAVKALEAKRGAS